jgi:hypothetical protein
LNPGLSLWVLVHLCVNNLEILKYVDLVHLVGIARIATH